MESYRSKSRKPPKLHAKPGEFYQDTKGQLYCLVKVYRLKDDPHTWIYVLEERTDYNDPSTPLSLLCEAVVGKKFPTHGKVEWEPCHKSEALRLDGDFAYGNRLHVTNQRLLNGFKLMKGLEG